MSKKKRRARRARIACEYALGIQEASGLARIADDTFLVVDDEQGIFRVELGKAPKNLEAGKGMADLEGICVTPDCKTAYVLSERDGSVWSFAVGKELTKGKRLGVLPRKGKKKNHGWEGIAFHNGELYGVHQATPRAVGVFDAATLKPRSILRLPKDARKVLGELNDIAYDETNDRVLLLSGRAGRVACLHIDGEDLLLSAVHAVDTSKRDIPEGLTCADGRTWLCTDGEGHLRELSI